MLFLSVLNMSITASCVLLVVLLVRPFLKKAPKIFSYALWAVVLFRLLCPFSFESAMGLLPINATPIPQDIMYSSEPQIDTGLNIVDNVVNQMLPIPNITEDSVNPLQIWVFVGSVVWAIGILAMLLYSFIQLVMLKRKLIGATPLRDNIYLSDHISSPFVMGFIKPRIYLPSSMAESEQVFIIAHEKYHIKRFDHITRILAFVALTIHWFNPLAWFAFVLSSKDMEMSCDEAVMKKMNADIRAEYSQSLLRFATGKKLITATPLAFGEGDTKDRVKNVMKYKKPMLWVSIVAVVMVICISVGFMTNPKSYTILNPYVQDYIPRQGNIRGNVDVESYKKISMDFDVGADKYGVAVFKNPHKAFETFEKVYADGIEYLQKEYDLPHLSQDNYDIYKTYGWQMTDGTKEQESQGLFISSFLDIYENSFQKSPSDTEHTEPTSEESPYDQTVASALFSLANEFPMGECVAEGHIILGYDDSNKNETQIYALTAISSYGFENGNFVEVSGSAFPTVITLFNDNHVEIKEPLDGSDYAVSIEKMFPKEYHKRIFDYADSDRQSIEQQKEKYAMEYLSKIGRDAKVGGYSDFEHISLTDAGVSVEVSNKLEDFYKQHNYYPSFIGTRERLENGVRVVYEMNYEKNQDEIKFIKYNYEAKEIIEQFRVNAKTGKVID